MNNPNRPPCDVAGHEWREEYYGDTCVHCGLLVPNVAWEDEEDGTNDDWDGEPIGSCENCESNLYPDDNDGLCSQCAWYAEQR